MSLLITILIIIKDKSWSAISLRGYSPEWSFITKPAEMSKKWKEENKDVEFKLQDTELRKMFPEVEELLKMVARRTTSYSVYEFVSWWW